MKRALTLAGYYAEMVADRRRNERDDLTWSLLQAEIDGDRLSDDEVIGFLFLLVVAGNETTTKLLGNAWYWGWRNPDQRAKPLGDPAWVPNWVEETLRYDTSTQMLVPVTRQPVRVQNVEIEPASGCCCSSGRPTATRRSSAIPRPTTSNAPPRIWSASAAAATSAWVPRGRMEARGRAGRAGAAGAGLRRRPRRGGSGALHQRARLCRAPHDGDAAVTRRDDGWQDAVRVRDAALRVCAGSPAHGRHRCVVGHRRRRARRLAEAGHPVVLGARRTETCEEIAAAIRAEGGDAAAFHLDLAEPASISAFAKEAEERVRASGSAGVERGSHSAGERRSRPSPEDFEEVLRVNVGGAQRLVLAFGAAWWSVGEAT